MLLAWCRITTFPHVGRVTPLIPLHALPPATTLEMFWRSYVASGRSMFLPSSTKPGDSALFQTVLQCVSYCLCHIPLACSPGTNTRKNLLEGRKRKCKVQTPRLFQPLQTLSTSMRTTFGIAWHESRFLVIFLLMYFVTGSGSRLCVTPYWAPFALNGDLLCRGCLIGLLCSSAQFVSPMSSRPKH